MTSIKGKWARLFAALLAVILTLGFSGCSSGSDDSSSDSDSSDTSEVEENKRRVGFIFREKVEDGGFAGQLSEQRERAANRCSMDTCYIDGVSVTDFEAAVKKLADDGCTDIVSGSPTYANMLGAVAKKYLDLNFISYGALADGLNVGAYSEAPYQGAYVAGLAADYNSKAKKIGVVVDDSLDFTVPVINAVQLGSLLNQGGGSQVYAANAQRPAEIKQAIDAMLAEGCDVIVCYTCSPYAADYCQQKGVRFIGSLDYSDNEEDYPDMLMYFYSHRDSYLLAQFKSLKMDSWVTDPYVGDMTNGIISVSNALKAADNGTQKLMDALVPHVTNGSARPFKGVLRDTEGNIRQIETDEMSERQIAAMEWYVENVEYLGNYRAPLADIDPGELEIKT